MRNYRFESDRRRVAAVLLAISITVCWFPLARLAPLINRDGETARDGIEFAALVGNLIAVAIGLLGIAITWADLVHDIFHPSVTLGVLVFEILALIPYVTDIVMIYKGAEAGPEAAMFIPAMYNPTSSDVWFVGAMGMIGAATFCLFLFGSYALLMGILQSYHAGAPEKYNAGYYRGRLIFYSAVMAIAGLAQMSLGTYVIDKFGNGPLPAPITAAMFVVYFPEINVCVGLMYVANGLWGMLIGLARQMDGYFAISMCIQLVCTLILMVLVQTSYAPGGVMAEAIPTLASLTIGVSLTPIFLDSMARITPEQITHEYYHGHSKHGDSELHLFVSRASSLTDEPDTGLIEEDHSLYSQSDFDDISEHYIV